MRKRSGLVAFHLGFALAMPAAVLGLAVFATGGEAQGQEPRAVKAKEHPAAHETAADGGDERHDPNNVAGIARWMEACVAGNVKFTAHDVPGAIESYKAALRLAPKNPYIYYLLAQAYETAGSLDEAETAISTAEQMSDKRDALLRAKILFVHADLKEHEKRWDEAKAGYQAYNEWVVAQSDGGTFPLSASARIRAIEDALRLDRATAVVRERIAGNFDAGAPSVSASATDAGRARP